MLNLITLTSLLSLGLFIAGQPDYLLFKFRHLLASLLGGVYIIEGTEGHFGFEGFATYIWKPFWGCATCMASFWGVITYLLFARVSYETIYELPVVILCSVGVNFIIFNNLIKKWLNG